MTAKEKQTEANLLISYALWKLKKYLSGNIPTFLVKTERH